MNKVVVIIDPISSGSELAPAFKSRGVSVVAVVFDELKRNGFGADISEAIFDKVLVVDSKLENELKNLPLIAIIPGTETAVPISEKLTAKLLPHLANDMSKADSRINKGEMQKQLKKDGIPRLETINTNSKEEVCNWIKKNELENKSLVVKPPISAGSDKVFHISKGESWEKAFSTVLSEPSKITKKLSTSVVVQEEAIGIEYAVGTVSVDGEHFLTHLIKYNKIESKGRKTVFDFVEFIPYVESEHRDLLEYTKKVLTSLGIKWGASHTEVFQTKDGPRLIEAGARMIGGPTVSFSRESNGSSQVDKLVEIYLDGEVKNRGFEFKKTVIPVFLKATKSGVISNLDVLDKAKDLSTFFEKHIWHENGEHVLQTVDYLSSIGIIALSGERSAALEDYKKIRQMELALEIKS